MKNPAQARTCPRCWAKPGQRCRVVVHTVQGRTAAVDAMRFLADGRVHVERLGRKLGRTAVR